VVDSVGFVGHRVHASGAGGLAAIARDVARNLLFGALLLTSVPFAITQLRFALYPQLADPGGYVVNEPATVAQLGARVMGGMAATPAPNYAPPASNLVPPPPRLEEVLVTGAKRTANNRPAESSSSILVSEQRFAPGTLVQAGPGFRTGAMLPIRSMERPGRCRSKPCISSFVAVARWGLAGARCCAAHCTLAACDTR